jgi:hypothetical protein
MKGNIGVNCQVVVKNSVMEWRASGKFSVAEPLAPHHINLSPTRGCLAVHPNLLQCPCSISFGLALRTLNLHINLDVSNVGSH